jgi:hypothetical protein
VKKKFLKKKTKNMKDELHLGSETNIF